MTKREKTILMAAAALLLVFAILAAWQAAQANSARTNLAEARAELDLQRAESTLALGAIEANRGSYELARQLASSFFTVLQGAIPTAPAAAREPLGQILQQRDPMITALSRSDPQVASQLVQLLIRFRLAMGEPVGPQPPAQRPDQPAPATPGE